MKVVWTEDDATPGTEGHVTLSCAWKRRYNEKWSDARKTATKVSDNGDCIEFTLPDGIVVHESYPGENQISEPDNYWLSAAWVTRIVKAGDENIVAVDVNRYENNPYHEHVLLTVKQGHTVDLDGLVFTLHELGVPNVSVCYKIEVQEQG